MNQSLVLLWSPSGTSALVCGSHPANDAQPDGLNSVSFTIKVDKAAIIFTTFKDRKRKDLNLSLQSSFLGKLPRESQFYIFPCVKIRSLHFFFFFPSPLYSRSSNEQSRHYSRGSFHRSSQTPSFSNFNTLVQNFPKWNLKHKNDTFYVITNSNTLEYNEGRMKLISSGFVYCLKLHLSSKNKLVHPFGSASMWGKNRCNFKLWKRTLLNDRTPPWLEIWHRLLHADLPSRLTRLPFHRGNNGWAQTSVSTLSHIFFSRVTAAQAPCARVTSQTAGHATKACASSFIPLGCGHLQISKYAGPRRLRQLDCSHQQVDTKKA